MTSEERDTLRQLYQFRCGYCGTSEGNAGAALTVDHIRPRSRGGTEQASNWVYCCHACNEFKGDLWRPNSPRRILHPLQNDLATHISEEPIGTLTGLTETGRFHIERLRLNRPPLVGRRREQQRNAMWQQTVDQLAATVQDLRQRMAEVEQTLFDLRQRLE